MKISTRFPLNCSTISLQGKVLGDSFRAACCQLVLLDPQITQDCQHYIGLVVSYK
uniref:Uncharacterized protein n=1 Tax=Solanum lycopersicum TaxID=4081 RepID=A0A3Q7I1S5_SOLLC